MNEGWAFGAAPAEISLRCYYDRVEVRAALERGPALSLVADAPLPLAVGDLQFFSSVHAANLPNGLRLLQIDIEHTIARAERAQLRLESFDSAAFGVPGLAPSGPVVASVALCGFTLGRVRFASQPEKLAFEATEKLG